MRLLFGIFLALAIILLVAIQWGATLTGAGKNSLLTPELNPEKIKLLGSSPASQLQASSVGSPPRMSNIVSAPVATVTQAMAISSVVAANTLAPASGVQNLHVTAPSAKASQVLSPVVPVPASASGKSSVIKSCINWGEFSGTDLERAEKELALLNLGNHLSRNTIEYESGYWVYIPPLKSTTAINKKIDELKAAGVEEYYVLREARNKWHNAISLGVFKTEESARQLLAALKKKKIKNLKIGERKGKLRYIVFGINDIDGKTVAQLENLQKSFNNSELKKVECKNN